MPLRFKRFCESRDKSVGDFGVGWKMSLSNVRLQKNRSISAGWFEDLEYAGTLGSLPTFCISSLNPKIVTIVFPDNKVYKFQTGQTPQCQLGGAITNPTITFQQINATAGTAGATLVPADGGNVLIDGGVPSGNNPLNLLDFNGNFYNPTQFVLTLSSGIQFAIDQKLGITSVTDTNGNTLTINASGITSSTGANVVFNRDTQGRITSINDLNGK